MGLYTNQGLYNKYKKNNTERAQLDFYCTPPEEVTNILELLGIDFSGSIILEPSAGEGHMVKGIQGYLDKHSQKPKILLATEIMEREPLIGARIFFGERYDFLSDDYPQSSADYIIMNPPYSTIEPFCIRGLEIAKKGMLVLGRLQFLEGKSRYDNLLKENPPSKVYVYIDRIKCYKNGDFTQNESSAQAYAWFYWDKEDKSGETKVYWMHRAS